MVNWKKKKKKKYQKSARWYWKLWKRSSLKRNWILLKRRDVQWNFFEISQRYTRRLVGRIRKRQRDAEERPRNSAGLVESAINGRASKTSDRLSTENTSLFASSRYQWSNRWNLTLIYRSDLADGLHGVTEIAVERFLLREGVLDIRVVPC